MSFLWNFKEFIKSIPPGQTPKLLIVGLDQWEFNSNWEPKEWRNEPFDFVAQEPLALAQQLCAPIYRHWQTGSLAPGQLLANSASNRLIGLTANINHSGFRYDGSHAETQIPAELSERFADAFGRIAAGSNRFEYGQNVSEARVAILRDFIELCHERGTHVTAFLPPFPHQVFETMRSHGEDYAYAGRIYETILPLFEKYHFTLQDYSDINWLGASDSETLDGFHGSEKAYLRLLIHLAARDMKLRERIDAGDLERNLGDSNSNVINPVLLNWSHQP